MLGVAALVQPGPPQALALTLTRGSCSLAAVPTTFLLSLFPAPDLVLAMEYSGPA